MRRILVLICISLLPLVVFGQKLPEKEICAGAFEALFQRGTIGKYTNTYDDEGRKIHVIRSRDDPRNSDGAYIIDNRIIWRPESFEGSNLKGRWRNSAMDEIITFKITGDKLTITVKDYGSTGYTQDFSIKQLSQQIK